MSEIKITVVIRATGMNIERCGVTSGPADPATHGGREGLGAVVPTPQNFLAQHDHPLTFDSITLRLS